MDRIRRREFLIATAGLISLISSSGAGAQRKILRVGYLATTSPKSNERALEAFRDSMRQLGYVEGQNLAIDYRWTEDSVEGLPALATELIGLGADALLAWTTPVVIAARKATTTLPIVMVGVADPVGSGLAASLARPGGNATGVSNISSDLSGKLVEMLVQLVPGITRIAGMRNLHNPASSMQLRETAAAAKVKGLQYQDIEVGAPADLEPAFAGMRKSRTTGVVFFADGLFVSQRERIAQLGAKYRIATVFSRRENVEAGGLVAYGASLAGQFRQTATYIDKIYKGTRPSDLPIEQPRTFELVVNRRTASALGLSIPQELLIRADDVIE